MNLADQTPRRNGRAGAPWQSRTEYLVDQALQSWDTSDEALRYQRPQGVPDRPLFPARTGMRRSEATIRDVLNIDRYMATNRSWVSGFPIEYRNGERVYTAGEPGSDQATSRNSQGSLWV